MSHLFQELVVAQFIPGRLTWRERSLAVVMNATDLSRTPAGTPQRVSIAVGPLTPCGGAAGSSSLPSCSVRLAVRARLRE